MTSRRGSTRGFWPMRDLPVVFWLVAVALAALTHPALPAPRWLMIHLLLLGAVTHAILVWSRYFTDSLLRVPDPAGGRSVQTARLATLNLGVLAVVGGVLSEVWAATLAGAVAVVTAVVWHGVSLVRSLRRSLPARFAVTVRYYVAAACLLPVGVSLGVWMARGLPSPLHEQVTLAHMSVNVLGWMGLTVVGTLVTLWPTILRTRIPEGSERAARDALPVLVTAVLLAAVGATAGLRPVAAAGLIFYLAGLTWVGRSFLAAVRGKPATSYSSWSVLAGFGWLLGSLALLAGGLLTADSWVGATRAVDHVSPLLAAGFGAQTLLGALSYLVPVALGGGPTPVRAAQAALDRGAPVRLVVVNAGLLVCAAPVPSTVLVAASVLVLGGLAAFIPLLFSAIRASRRARATDPAGATGARSLRETTRPRGQVSGAAAVGLATVLLAVATGVALDPGSAARAGSVEAASAGAVATGETTTVRVEARDMQFFPAAIGLPVGNRLVIELHNGDDEDVHDLVLESGARTTRLTPGETVRLDVGVVGHDLDGWCSVVGHRQMGMTLTVRVNRTATSATGGAAHSHGDHAHGPDATQQHEHTAHDADPAPTRSQAGPEPLDLHGSPGPGFEPVSAVLPPLLGARLHRRTLTVTEVDQEVAPGIVRRRWTYNGSAPGPVLHGRVGDVFEITLVNDGSIGHSVDFHAGSLAPDRAMRTLAPGESLVYRFRATRAGVWMYHCSTMPMSAHIASGMFGAVVIEPPGLPRVDRSYLLVQSELYLDAAGGPVDVDKLMAERPDAVVFNGYANQYDHEPLPARVGERVRVWVLDAGPNRPTSFHVVGGQFDTVWSEGAYLLPPGTDGGSQSLSLAPAQGGFVELSFPEPGRYPLVSHVMIDAERGAHGIFAVTR